MGKTEKLLEKFGNSKNTFPYKDLVVLLSILEPHQSKVGH